MRSHLQLAIDAKHHSLEKVFWQALETFGKDISASLCAFNRENREFGVRCDLDTEPWDRSSKRDILSECEFGNSTAANGTEPLQSLCKSLQVPGLSLNSVFFRPQISYSELETLLCCSSALSSSACLPYSRTICSSRYLQGGCYYPNCSPSMIENGICVDTCSPCHSDDLFCQCMQTCSQENLLNERCDRSCNVSACDYDRKLCLIEQSEGSSNTSWTIWIVGSLSIGCFLYGVYRVLGVLGCLVYSHMKRRERERVQSPQRSYAAVHSRSVSDASGLEEGVLVRAAATSQPISEAQDTAFCITSETIERFCPQMLYISSLTEFQEQICTVCLDE
jgi:hypothetical protein